VPAELQSLGLSGDMGSAQCTWHIGNPHDGAWGLPMALNSAALCLLQKPALTSLFPFSTRCCPGTGHSVPHQPGTAKFPLLSEIIVPSLGLPHRRAHPWTGLMG
jgi:hypothetical protein